MLKLDTMKKIDIQEKSLSKLSNNLVKALVKAFDFAEKRQGKEVNAEDFFCAILSDKGCFATKLLERLGVESNSTLMGIELKYKDKVINKNIPTEFGEKARKILARAFLISHDLRHVYVGTEHLLLSILSEDEFDFVKDLAKVGLNYDKVAQAMLSIGVYQPGVFSSISDKFDDTDKQKSLSFFSKDMNALAKSGKYLKVWGRDDEIERIIHILSRKTKNNALLVGEAGVGKTAIVEGMVQRIAEGNVPPSFKNKKIVQLDVSAIIAGSKIRGDVEERLLGIISEMAANKDVIIFIDEIHMIVGAGTAGPGNTMDIANIIKPYLTNGDLRVIGSTTFDEYQQYIEEDDALARRFQTIMVNEISKSEAVEVLRMLKPQFEKYHNVKIPDEVIVESVDLSSRYIANKYLPDKAIDVIDEASAAIKISVDKKTKEHDPEKAELEETIKKKESALRQKNITKATKFREREIYLVNLIRELNEKRLKSRKKQVGVEDVRKVISKWSGVPVNSLTGSEVAKLNDIDKILKTRIIGQDIVIDKIASSLKRSRIGLSDANKPLSTFLFLGPTGVGKTQTAKEIAEKLYGNADSLIQVDMSEYMESHSVSKLIGSPPGYVGFQEGGQLTEKVRRKPYSVILFDEIEKAHPDLLNILLQILDEGHIQDSKGRLVNFKNTIIIMTSNIGAWESADIQSLGFNIGQGNKNKDDESYEKMKLKLIEVLKESLPPEFLNRIDEVLVFRKLDEKDAKKIVSLMVQDVKEKMKARNIILSVGDGLINFIVQSGFSEEYGARNLKRSVQEILENALVDYLIEKGYVNKQVEKVKVLVDFKKNKIQFS